MYLLSIAYCYRDLVCLFVCLLYAPENKITKDETCFTKAYNTDI